MKAELKQTTRENSIPPSEFMNCEVDPICSQKALNIKIQSGQQLDMLPPKRGKKPVYEKFPEIVPIVQNRVQDSGLLANVKTKSNTPHHGAHLSDIIKDVKSNVLKSQLNILIYRKIQFIICFFLQKGMEIKAKDIKIL